jgi:hypothetical protein
MSTGAAQFARAQSAQEIVNTVIRNEHARFENSPIRDYVPLLVEKCARHELKRKPSISPAAVST